MGSQWENSLKDATIKRLIDENNDLKILNQGLLAENEILKKQQTSFGFKNLVSMVQTQQTSPSEDPLDDMLEQVRSLINQLEQC